MIRKQNQEIRESLSSLKQHFCDTLKKHIKASKVRQLELAEVGLTIDQLAYMTGIPVG